MKVGNVEGTQEEINNFYANHGFNPKDLFESPLHWKWLAIPASLSALAVLLLVLIPTLSTKTNMLLFLFGGIFSVWAAVSLQIRFNNSWGTTVAIFGAVIVLLMAAGFLPPKEIIDAIKGLKGE